MRSGLEVMNFLMDLINHIAGYTIKYYDEIEEKMDLEDLVKKYRAEKEKYTKDINESPLLGDKYPHCLMVIEGVQELYRMRGCG